MVFATSSAVGLARTTFTVFHAGMGSRVSGQLDSFVNRPAKLLSILLEHFAKTAGFADKLA